MFDAYALYVMLRAFYPNASAAALAQAFAERPQYFGGGSIGGPAGDWLTLPDGRVFDLVYDEAGAAGGPTWYVSNPGGSGNPDAIELAPGPLTLLVEQWILPPPIAGDFREFIAPHLAGIDGHERALEVRQGELSGGADPSSVHAIYDAHLAPGVTALDAHVRAFADLDPSEVNQNTGGLGGAIHDAQNDYPDPESTAPPEVETEIRRPETPPIEEPDPNRTTRWSEV